MFLTLEDPRAKIQGSVDPLGVQPIWSHFGRHVVTNLTTVSNSVRGFTVLLLGRYLAEQLVEDGRADPEDALSIFLRTEQACGYARHARHDARDMRGVERIVARLEGSRSVTIDDHPEACLLSDQKVYGLWGLFSVPARVSGLLADGPVGLTQSARDFVESAYRPALRPVLSSLLRLVRDGGVLDTSKRGSITSALADAMPPLFTSAERTFYREYLRDALHATSSPPKGRQALLARLFASLTELAEPTSRVELLAVVKAARVEDAVLATRLERIVRLEGLAALAEELFAFLLGQHRQPIAAAAMHLADRWGRELPNLDDSLEDLAPEIVEATTEGRATLMIRCHAALRAGDYVEAIHALLDWNREVLAMRGSAPWVTESGGKLDVRYRGDGRLLAEADELPLLWRNTYFLDALKDVTRQLEEGD